MQKRKKKSAILAILLLMSLLGLSNCQTCRSDSEVVENPTIDVYAPTVPDPAGVEITVYDTGYVVIPLEYWNALLDYVFDSDLVILEIDDIIKADSIPNIIWEE